MDSQHKRTIALIILLAIIAVIYKVVKVKKDLLGKPRIEIVIKLCPNALKATPFTGQWCMNVVVTTMSSILIARLIDVFFAWCSQQWAKRPRSARELSARLLATALKLSRKLVQNMPNRLEDT